jgi:hypothetical protein
VFVTSILIRVPNEFCDMESREFNQLIYYKIIFFHVGHTCYMLHLSVHGTIVFTWSLHVTSVCIWHNCLYLVSTCYICLYMAQLSLPGLYMFRPSSAIIIEIRVTSNRSVWRCNTAYTNKPLMHIHIFFLLALQPLVGLYFAALQQAIASSCRGFLITHNDAPQ